MNNLKYVFGIYRDGKSGNGVYSYEPVYNKHNIVRQCRSGSVMDALYTLFIIFLVHIEIALPLSSQAPNFVLSEPIHRDLDARERFLYGEPARTEPIPHEPHRRRTHARPKLLYSPTIPTDQTFAHPARYGSNLKLTLYKVLLRKRSNLRGEMAVFGLQNKSCITGGQKLDSELRPPFKGGILSFTNKQTIYVCEHIKLRV